MVRKSYSPEFKFSIVLEALKERKTLQEIASEHGIAPSQISCWINEFKSNGAKVFSRYKRMELLEAELCKWYEIRRNSYYYAPKPKKVSHLNLRNQIKDKTKDPSSGSRRITAALNRDGIPVKRAIVRHLMKDMRIKGIIPKRNLNIPKPGAQKFPYFLKDLKVVRPNQVWSTDITYLKPPLNFIYLTAIIDVYSRKIISWELSNNMSKDFCINCYKNAVKVFGAPEILNSNQGSQYTSTEFIETVLSSGAL